MTAGSGIEGKSAAESQEQESYTSGFTNGAALPYTLPNLFKRHLVTRFSLGQVYDTGISNGNRSNSSDTYTETSASFAYDLQRKRSEYVMDYFVSARRYNRLHDLDSITHDLGLSQVVQLTPRLTWSLHHRFSLTPDFPGELLGESVAQQPLNAPISNNPFPAARVKGRKAIPPLINPAPGFSPATDGLVTLRSTRLTNNTAANLVYAMSPRTNVSLQAGYLRERFQDDNLLGRNNYSLSAGMNRALSARTNIGVLYQARRFEQSGRLGATTSHNVAFSVTRQLTPNTTVQLMAGPWWANGRTQERVPLSPVLADLLGRQVLAQDATSSMVSWMGSASLLTNWHKWNVGLTYNRSISNTNILSQAANGQTLGLNLGKQLMRDTNISVYLSYQQNEFFGVRDSLQVDQGTLRVALTQKLSSGLDFSVFFDYSKLFTGGQGIRRLNHGQFGVRFFYHFPRLGRS